MEAGRPFATIEVTVDSGLNLSGLAMEVVRKVVGILDIFCS